MATQAAKRKAADSLEDSTKRLRIKGPLPASDGPSSPIDEDDDDGSEYCHDKDDFSDDGRGGVDTPVTPFSPGRKKFPSEYKTILCTFPGCTKTFNRPARMKAHLVTHTNDRPYPCPYDDCDKTYIEDKHLQQHIKGTHTQERKWVCDWEGCDKSFLTGTRLRRHKEAHQGHERFRCTGYAPCNKTFRKHNTLQRHIRSDHLELAPFPCTYKDPFTDEPCNAGFDGAVGLRKHVDRVHSAPQFVCSSCTAPYSFNEDGTPKFLAFTTAAQLQTHIRKEHAEAECMFCDKKCSSQRELDKHVESQHSGKSLEERKNIPCTYAGCNKTFTKKSNLSVHIRTVHNGERFICGTFDTSSNPALEAFDAAEDGCGKDFVSKASLEDHIRTGHLGLSSIINANRKKTPSSALSGVDLDFIDDEDDEFAPKKNKRKTRKQKQKPNAIDELLGSSYAVGEPSVLDPMLPVRATATPTPAPSFQDPMAESFFEAEADAIAPQFEEADLDWQLQQQMMGDRPFWYGDGDLGVQSLEEWDMEQEEMRMLIDPDLFGA
ncbi:Transcription factor IIIA [Lachnellula suecica]|uniref:Transcription factor IIIA n=1 Tax=Lachnellula suecica TaxID=602035 RepID=A0A8T9C7C8_9HELO|nr:Transcription factor IIIA [Lachnellula suecica]